MNETYDYDLVCIGSGPSGQRAAIQAAKLRKRVVLVEKRHVVGGECLGTGTIPSKTFREAVISLLHHRKSGNHGGSQETSGRQLHARVADVLRRESEVIENQLSRNGVEVVFGTASFGDAHTVVVDTDRHRRRLTTDHVVIACGTRPATPPGLAFDGRCVVDSDQIVDIDQLPRTLAVVGGGVIGIEYASMYAALGVQVTLVERRERPLEFLDREIVDELTHQMRDRGVSFRCGESLKTIAVDEGPPRRAILELESGKRIGADMVFFSVGRVGNTAALGLEAAGLSADERGRLTVDTMFRTSVPNIFAVGDVIGYPSLAATSMEQGRLAACHAFGAAAGEMSNHFPIGIYAIPEISMVGATEQELTEKKIPYEIGVARYREIARGQILGDNSGFFKMIFHRDTRRLLGAHCMGTGATELIHIGQAVLALGGGLDYFLTTVFNYPTLAECYKVAALNAANRLAGSG